MNRQWCLARRPRGSVSDDDLELRSSTIPDLEAGQVLVRVVYLSLDPTNRIWMNERASYLPPIAIGDVMRGIALGVVERSRHEGFAEGTLVQGTLGWQEYAVSDGRDLSVLPPIPGMPLTAHFGLFGHIGLTAYFGLLDVGQPKHGETLVVSGAGGAVGSLTGQLGKIHGLRVVGIAGTDEKCEWITGELGFDAAINYKTEHVASALGSACPNGIDIYFDNVGGGILDAALARMNLFGRIPLCGLISGYNAETPVPGPANFPAILIKRLRVQGFIVLDYLPRAGEAITALAGWYHEGRLRYRVDVIEGIEHAVEGLGRLFAGGNIGKLLVRVSGEPT